jgi:hypothetical protein
LRFLKEFWRGEGRRKRDGLILGYFFEVMTVKWIAARLRMGTSGYVNHLLYQRRKAGGVCINTNIIKQTGRFMRKIIKHTTINHFGLALALAATLICGCSCSTSKPTPDPLAGFHFSSLANLQTNNVISDDCRAYINSLPAVLKNGVGPMQFFEDAAGQHAVLIAVADNGTDWAYVLIYDKNNKRIKVIKYVSGHYRS